MDKRVIVVLVINVSFVFILQSTLAQNLLETRSEAKQRRGAQEYEYESNNPYGGEPLGGHQETLGTGSIDTSPYSQQSENNNNSYQVDVFETREETTERNNTERYNQRQDNAYGSEPLGGYSQPLGETGSGYDYGY
jgi:hypothetical protein